MPCKVRKSHREQSRIENAHNGCSEKRQHDDCGRRACHFFGRAHTTNASQRSSLCLRNEQAQQVVVSCLRVLFSPHPVVRCQSEKRRYRVMKTLLLGVHWPMIYEVINSHEISKFGSPVNGMYHFLRSCGSNHLRLARILRRLNPSRCYCSPPPLDKPPPSLLTIVRGSSPTEMWKLCGARPRAWGPTRVTSSTRSATAPRSRSTRRTCFTTRRCVIFSACV